MTRPLVEKVYPSPSPPKGNKKQFLDGSKEDFTKIRQAAKKAPNECLDSFDALKDYLQQESVTTDLAKVRFFFEWLLIKHTVSATSSATTQKVTSSPVQLTSCFLQGCESRPTAEEPVSPGDWLGRCHSDFQMYTDFFMALCSKSGVGCVIIQGYVKGAGFEGEKASRWNCPWGRWVAVNLAGEWRFINPPWAFVSDQQAGDDDDDPAGEFALVGNDRKAAQIEDNSTSQMKKGQKKAQEKTVHTTEENPEEFWFLTDPAAFNAFCHAEDKKWQLLNSDGLWTDSEFLQKPRYTEEYFKSSKWHLLLEESGVLKAEKGQCIISYAYPVSAKTAYLRYNLYLKSQPSTSPKDGQDLPDFNRHVVHEYRDKGQVRIVSLITRLPQYGLYKIEIAGVLDGDLQPLNEFVINAVNVPKKSEPFQEICQDVGVFPEARAQGVVAEEEKGIILVKPERQQSLRFTITLAKLSESTLSAFLTHSYRKDEELQKFVQMETTKDEVNKKAQTEMKVCLPQDKSVPFEYCLTIRKGLIDVARYILTGDKILTFPKENAIIDIKSNILSAITKSDFENVKMMSKKYKSKLGPNIRNMIINLMTVPPPEVVEDVEDVVESDELRVVEALRAALKNNNNETHLADLESALAAAIRLGIKRGDHDNIIQVAESALIKLYEVELQRAVRKGTRKAVEKAIQHAKDSCIADQVKQTEPYGRAINLPNIFK